MGYSYSEQEESIVCSSHQADHWGAFMGVFVTRGHDTDTAIRGTVRVRHKDDPSHYLIQNSWSLFNQESKLLKKIIISKILWGLNFADWLHLLSGHCQQNYPELRGSVKWYTNVLHILHIAPIPVVWSIMENSVETKGPVVPNVLQINHSSCHCMCDNPTRSLNSEN